MAGIGFELRKITSTNSFFNFLRAHVYAGVLSSGSWIISISILISIFFYITKKIGLWPFSIQFLVAVTYLISLSLILSSFFYQVLVSYVSDRIFEHKYKLIIPALSAVSLVLMIISSILAVIGVQLLLDDQPLTIKLLMGSSFIVLNLIWLYTNTLSGLKNYKFILVFYVLSYVCIFLLAINLFQYKLNGLLLAVFSGHALLLTAFIVFTFKNYTASYIIRWDFFRFMRNNKWLVAGGVFFQLGVWVDKYCFWIYSDTSIATLGKLRSSPIYDIPMFIAFVLLIPGLSVLFYEIESNFSRYYERYYDAIREGATLDEINDKRVELVAMARSCFMNAFKVQVFIVITGIIFATEIIRFLGLAPVYTCILRVDLLSSCFFICLLAQVCFFYHFKKYFDIACLMIIFFFLSLTLTLLTFKLGPWFYGYGFVVAVFIINLLAFYKLNRDFEKLTYYSFMSIGED